ncbi:hypothetical protein ABBQ32_009185 [Trebouxia sp. C0010 RCD-2024]
MSYQDPLLAYLPDRPPGKRRRAKKHSDLNTDVAHADTWHKQYQVYQDWRDKSATLQRIRNNAFRFQQTCDAVKRGLQQAQSQIADQVDSSRDAVVIALKQQLRAARSKLRRALQQQQQQRASEDCLGADLAACSKCVRGSKQDSQSFALGILVFGALAFVCGSAPWMLPGLYLAFASVALPWRFQQFYRKRLTFFLLDFCYWTNLATVAFMLFGSSSPQSGTMVYALADGPMAAALLVWQSAWVFGSAAHCVSVLIHLLPGLALFAHRHFPPPASVAHIRLLNPIGHGGESQDSAGLWWLLIAPVMFYAAWQTIYWFIVQVCCQQFIKNHGYETSYSCLAKRAAKTNNVWNRIVRQGCKARRICMFGAIQLVFTVGCLLVFAPLYHSFYLSCIWQVVKFAVPVYYGSCYQCEKVPQHQVVKAVQSKKLHISLTADAKSATSQPGLN